MKGKKKSVDPRVEQLEKKFQEAQEKRDIKTIQLCIWDCVENIIKGLVKGHPVDPDILLDRINEAQVLMLNWYNNKITKDQDFRINNLVNALYIQTVFSYRSRKHMFEDRNVANFTDLALDDIDKDAIDLASYENWLRDGNY